MIRSTRNTNLTVEALDDRLVPATVLDLTHPAQVSTVSANGFVAQFTHTQPTGTGVIQSFVRIQGAASGGGIEQGYNTTARPLQFDENKSPQFTRALTVGEVPTVSVNGVTYRQFLLDINQKSSSPLLSVDEVRIFLDTVPNDTGYDPAAKTLAGKAPVFDMDAGPQGDVSVLLDARLNSGSGSGDMFLLIPDTAFANADLGTYVYLYSKMGGQPGATANGGFEEWSVRTSGTTNVLPPGTASISGVVYLDADHSGTLTPGDTGIGGVTVELRGVNDAGQTVVLLTTTDSNGNYSFTGLRTGTYSILETQPAGYLDGAENLGTVNGQADGLIGADQFYDVYLPVGATGINYDFGELLPPPPPIGGSS
ncbi:MAG: hypothetical protein JWO38_156 [Gemmataceae bacterium]|nr:hypothetical protein [Gemmataceae bacterium]